MNATLAVGTSGKSSVTPVQTQLLQRKCECGGAAGLTGSCETCDGSRLSPQRATQDSRVDVANARVATTFDVTLSPRQSPQATSTPAFIGSGLGHNFGALRVHPEARDADSSTTKNLAVNAVSGDQPRRASLETTSPRSNSRGRIPGEDDPTFVVGNNRAFLNPSVEATNQRPGGGDYDPVHRGMLDAFRDQQGQPPGGVDAEGNQVGPTDAEIKYRPQPIAVLNGPFHAPIDTPAVIGMEIQITVQSSSGNNAAMAQVQDSEQVSPSLDHTGSFAALAPIVGGTSGFMPAVNIPNDRHGVGRAFFTNRADNFGGSGSISFQQLDIYTHPRYAIFNPIAIPNSGYRITQRITAGPGTQLRLRTDKAPEACTVNGFSSTAGPSPAQHDEVLVRA
jgi:hypothetical protein